MAVRRKSFIVKSFASMVPSAVRMALGAGCLTLAKSYVAPGWRPTPAR